MKHPKFSHAFEVVANMPAPLQPLIKLARNFHWSWHAPTRDLFRSIDRDLWDGSNHNPIAFLHRLSPEKLKKLQADEGFLARTNQLVADLKAYVDGPTWFDGAYPGEREKTKIAYFCAEFGLTEGLPIYSGGLGILAGDHLKAASDLGLPLVGVGLLYNRGYFRQRLNFDGWQQEFYPQYDFYEMPLSLMRGDNEQPIRIEVELPDRVVTCQVWKADVGRIQLYLLDSNVLENAPDDQSITDTLYGGDGEMRIRQEMILGIGGMRALRAVGINPTVCHMNEGHAAFLSIERIRQAIQDEGIDFGTARQVVMNGNVFTTHTPVPAGFDVFARDLLEKYMGKAVMATGLTFPEFEQFGRMDPDNPADAFNMAGLALSNANHVNGVAKLHAKVTRGMFHARWPGYPEDEVPVDAITNGVHTLTWISRRMAKLYDRFLGEVWRSDPGLPESWAGVNAIPDQELWLSREDSRGELVRFIRRRVQVDLERRNVVKPEFGLVGNIFDPRILTIGFARRFATYKRATLMLTDKERLLGLLNHAERPIQIVIAGKSHPRDDGGKKLIQELVHFINHEGGRLRMVFIEDYDMEVARHLVQGVDVWLNNPRRPNEASGTSGMKVVPNGGINCSILDGWWDEAYQPGLGFAIGDRDELGDTGERDWLDSRSLYNLLESEIAPNFYHRVDSGLPTQWIGIMKKSISVLAPYFSTHRMVRQYAEEFYMPAAFAYRKLHDDGAARAKGALSWKSRVRDAWPKVHVIGASDDAGRSNPLGKKVHVRAEVALGPLSPDEVRVQAIVGKIGPNRDLIDAQAADLACTGSSDGKATFEGEISALSPGHQGYTVRVIPRNEDVTVPNELPLVAWED